MNSKSSGHASDHSAIPAEEWMPKRYGVKDKDVVVAHIVSKLMDGSLRPGDRIDRTEIAAALGMSRVPVQEAVNQLEREGIVTIPYHRGVYLERFDPEVVREHYEIYGMLCGLASARVATHCSVEVAERLRELVDQMAQVAGPPGSGDAAEFENLIWEYRRAINQEVAGPRLRAAISAFQGFMPAAFWLAAEQREDYMLPMYREELEAIERGDGPAAREVVERRTALMADSVIAELRRRGVFEAEDDRPSGRGTATAGTATRGQRG
ncbi:MAG TPA: GntR family transcriptional regulator [Pseudonocardia sp.]